MSFPRKILFVQHAGALGGSSMSLLYTIQGLDRRRFKSVVALARPARELVELYATAGLEVLPWKGMVLWDHSTMAPKPLFDIRSWLHLGRVGLHWRKTQQSMLELVDTIKPDLVHLNSMPLSPCAAILIRRGIPFVWHIREPPPNQGLRTRMIRQIMMRAPRLIFISEFDRHCWVKDSAGDVISNFVDLNTFTSEADRMSVRQRMCLKPEEKVILFLGGNATANGVRILLEALGLLQAQLSNFICLMPGAEPKPSASWPGKVARKVLPLVGSGTLSQKTEHAIRVHGVANRVRLLPFAKNVPELLAACDVLVFPATQPHFARPVIEAAAMGKPSVGSDLGGVNELIEHNFTGLLVKPGSSSDLAAALKNILTSPEKLKAFGENAFNKAQREFDAKKQVAKIAKIYDSILGAGVH